MLHKPFKIDSKFECDASKRIFYISLGVAPNLEVSANGDDEDEGEQIPQRRQPACSPGPCMPAGGADGDREGRAVIRSATWRGGEGH